MRTKIEAMAALALLASPMLPLAAQATPITVDFTVTSTPNSTGSYGAGVVGSGYFTFDDSKIPAGGTGSVGNPILGVSTLDLAFNWYGTAFDETNAGIATLTFSNNVLTDWWIGGNYIPPVCGLQRYSCLHSAGAAPDFYLIASTGGGMNDGVHSGIGSATGAGAIQWSVRSTAVPEPASLGLLGLGLTGVGLFRRKRV